MSEINTTQVVPLRQLALASLYIGATGYGGPAIVGHMKRVFVERNRWIDEKLFLTGLGISQLLPGATGANLIGFLGYQVCGGKGALVAPLLFITPAFILMTALSAVYFSCGQLPVIQALFAGLGAVVVALLINATVTLGRSALKDRWSVVLALLSFTAVRFLHVNILLVVLAAAGAGLALYHTKVDLPEKARLVRKVGSLPQRRAPSRWRWLLPLIVAGAVLAGALIMTARFMTVQLILAMAHVGLLTFGGGFAAVPLFQHEAVSVHHWLSTRQFLDGIALGQVTPGPVMITATFVGYRLLGVWGAIIGTLAVFTPSCLAVFLLASRHETVTKVHWAQAMIKGIVAAFIGILAFVITQLAGHSLVDWKTVVLFLAALAVLLLGKKEPLWVVLGGVIVSPFLFS